MHIGEVHQGPTAGPAQSGRVPLWVMALTALLVAAGFARRPPRGPHPDRGDHANLEVGRDRSTATPSEIPAPGWKNTLLRVYNGISADRILANAAGVAFYAAPRLISRHRGSGFNLRPLCRPEQHCRSSRHNFERRTRGSDRRSSRANDAGFPIKGTSSPCDLRWLIF
jgi:hypothetical protein